VTRLNSFVMAARFLYRFPDFFEKGDWDVTGTDPVAPNLSPQYPLHHLPMHIGQAVAAALKFVGEPLVIS
jgi:hypothetical protein